MLIVLRHPAAFDGVHFDDLIIRISNGISFKILVVDKCDIELQKNGKNVFAISASQNSELVSVMHEFLKNGVLPTTSIGFRFDTEEEVKRAYNMLISGGTVHRPKRRHRT